MSETTCHPPFMEQLPLLCRAVENAIGIEKMSRSDFDILEMQIFNRLHSHISATTLKRVWGYVTTDSIPRSRTLDMLARFIGYTDFQHFCETRHDEDADASAPALTRHIDVEKDLSADDIITLFWNPGRVCTVRYLGSRRFIVTASENTRLVKGATFQCSLIIEGEPLFINNLLLNDQQPIAYVCGKKGGIQFQQHKREKCRQPYQESYHPITRVFHATSPISPLYHPKATATSSRPSAMDGGSC